MWKKGSSLLSQGRHIASNSLLPIYRNERFELYTSHLNKLNILTNGTLVDVDSLVQFGLATASYTGSSMILGHSPHLWNEPMLSAYGAVGKPGAALDILENERYWKMGLTSDGTALPVQPPQVVTGNLYWQGYETLKKLSKSSDYSSGAILGLTNTWTPAHNIAGIDAALYVGKDFQLAQPNQDILDLFKWNEHLFHNNRRPTVLAAELVALAVSEVKQIDLGSGAPIYFQGRQSTGEKQVTEVLDFYKYSKEKGKEGCMDRLKWYYKQI
jgi:hypothetical protein